jgi:hypothetical protein
MNNERTRYLGVVSLLCEASVYVPEEIRESIECALEDACSDGRLKWKRLLNRLEIESNPEFYEKAE